MRHPTAFRDLPQPNPPTAVAPDPATPAQENATPPLDSEDRKTANGEHFLR